MDEKKQKRLKKCPDSDLKDFLIKATESFSLCDFENEKETYKVQEWIHLNSLVIKYLNR